MKPKINFLYVFVLLVLFGCNQENNKAGKNEAVKLEKPENSYFTENQIQDYINKEINLAINIGNGNVIEEAANVVALTRSAVSSIVDKHYGEAIDNIDKAVAKAKLITSDHENTKVISEVNIEIQNKVKNAETASQLINRTDSLMDRGEYQKAKELMNRLTSELRITRESISISSYLQTLQKAAQLLQSKQYENAMLELNSILGNVIVERSTNPVPLIIAGKITDELVRLSGEQEWNKQDFQTLLGNLDYQIRFSKLLGYGKTETGYNDILNEISQIKNNLNDTEKGKVKNLISELSRNLKQLDSDISAYNQVNMNSD